MHVQAARAVTTAQKPGALRATHAPALDAATIIDVSARVYGTTRGRQVHRHHKLDVFISIFFPHCPLQSEKKCWEMDFLLRRNGILTNALHESALALCVRMCACVGTDPSLLSEVATRTVNAMKNV